MSTPLRAPLKLQVRAARVAALACALSVQAAGAAAAEGPSVPTLRVQASATGSAVALDGHIEAIRQATVAAQVAGNVTALLVKAGDRVRAGQALARIDERSASAALAQGDAAVRQAEAGLQQARLNLARTRDLQRQGYLSQAALDNADSQFKAAEAAWQQAQAGRSQAALARGFTSVVAPFDGWVLATHVNTGDLAGPGRPVATVYAPGGLRAVVQLPASQAAQARSAPQVEVLRPDGRWVRPVSRTELPSADPVSQTVEWRLDLATADGQGLLPGQAVQVRFLGASAGASAQPATAAPQRLTLPARAILRRGELTAVYVVQDGVFSLRAIRAGSASSGDANAPVPVLAGLKPGDEVAMDGVRAGLSGARPALQPAGDGQGGKGAAK